MSNINSKVELTVKNCSYCKEKRNGDCLGLEDANTCLYYKEVPTHQEEVSKNWPQGMTGGGDYEPWYYR